MIRQSYEISHPEYMHIERGERTLYGCDQDWYEIEWRRRAGCGPVAATNILLYMRKKYDVADIPYYNGSVEEALEAMNDVYQFVRPRRRGLHTVRRFVKGMCKFGRRYGLSFRYRYLVIPPQAEKRPGIDEIIGFIEEGLEKDVPVAFLNLHAGSVEEQLSSWHWVTVVGIEKGGMGRAEILLRFYDQSNSLAVSLGEWLDTTEKGGGFAYFCRPSQHRGQPRCGRQNQQRLNI